MFEDFVIESGRPAYLQIKDYLKKLIFSGVFQAGVRLPATRELATVLAVSRNTITQAYQDLEDEGFLRIDKGQGAFVAVHAVAAGSSGIRIDWETRINPYARAAADFDLEKRTLHWKEGMISFRSIAPDPELFDLDDVKRAFLNRLALEGQKLLNYGYAQGYQYLLDYLREYMMHKGVDLTEKEILVTNGFTEGFHLVVAALTQPGERVVCENPTHNTALKIMRLAGLTIDGIPMGDGGIVLAALEAALAGGGIRFGFLIPSYHNPTGLVMSPEKRRAVLELFQRYQVPVIEDGFNEELRYSGAHVAPLMALAGVGNNVVYIGSFSKILFPGIRVGWIVADRRLIAYLESIKRSYNIHTSFLDQAVLCDYLQNGRLEKYLKKARRVYKERHQMAIELAKAYIPCRRIRGEGGLHIFIELEPRLNARRVLDACHRQGVMFMPGDVFYTDGQGQNTFRLGIARVTPAMMAAGFKIIGAAIRESDGGTG